TARQYGYSDDEIKSHLDKFIDVNTALNSGYSLEEIAAFVTKKPTPTPSVKPKFESALPKAPKFETAEPTSTEVAMPSPTAEAPGFTTTPEASQELARGMFEGAKGAGIEEITAERKGLVEELKSETEHPLARMGKSFAKGITGTASGIGGALSAVGIKPVGDAITKATKALEENYLKIEDPTFLDQVVSGFGSAATFLVPGVGVMKGAQMLPVATKIAAVLGTSAAAFIESAVEAGSTYNESLARGKDENQARKDAGFTFVSNLPLNFILDKWMFNKFPEGKRITSALKGASQEAVQETVQQVISSLAQEELPTAQELGTSAGVGLITGGTIGGAKVAPSVIKDIKKKVVAPTTTTEEAETTETITADVGGTTATEKKFETPEFKEDVKMADVVVPAKQMDPLTRMATQNFSKPYLQSVPEDHTILYYDVDKFKLVNDYGSEGHLSGDKVLNAIGKLAEEYFPGQVRLRDGGEEFAIDFGSTEITPEIIAKAREFQDAVPQEIKVDGSPVTISSGLGRGKMEGGRLLADKLNYESKKTGRNRLTIDKDGEKEYYIGRDIGEKKYVTIGDLYAQRNAAKANSENQFLPPEIRERAKRTLQDSEWQIERYNTRDTGGGLQPSKEVEPQLKTEASEEIVTEPLAGTEIKEPGAETTPTEPTIEGAPLEAEKEALPEQPPREKLSTKIQRKIADIQADKAKNLENIREQEKKFGLGGGAIPINPELLSAYVKHAGLYIEEGVLKTAELSARLVEDIGEHIRPHLQEIIRQAKKNTTVETPPPVKKTIKKITGVEKPVKEVVVDEMKGLKAQLSLEAKTSKTIAQNVRQETLSVVRQKLASKKATSEDAQKWLKNYRDNFLSPENKNIFDRFIVKQQPATEKGLEGMKRKAMKLVDILEEREQRKQSVSRLKTTVKEIDVGTLRPEYKKVVEPLVDIDLTKHTGNFINRLRAMAAFAEKNPDNTIPEDVLGKLKILKQKPIEQYTTDELNDIDAAIKNYVHLNKLKNKLIQKGKIIDFKEKKDRALANLSKREIKKPESDIISTREKEYTQGPLKQIFTTGSYTPNTVTQLLDNEKHGVIKEVFFEGFREGLNKQIEFQDEALAEIKGKIGNIDTDSWSEMFHKDSERSKKVDYIKHKLVSGNTIGP
ncbi:MAG: diguanylate cyclase, partial [Nanoarchaeota archaeon]